MPVKKKRHDGYNVKRLREILGIKQEALVSGLKMDQSQISRLESRDVIEDELLAQIANILQIPADAIKNFSDETAMAIISNWCHNASLHHANSYSNMYTGYAFNFNPFDKIIELYERLLAAEKGVNRGRTDFDNPKSK